MKKKIQSGDIQISYDELKALAKDKFTFQYGDTSLLQKNLKRQFTFQSGNIQIKPTSVGMKRTRSIYIPIWWYSNGINDISVCVDNDEFTFQSGDIQMIKLNGYHSNCICNLHSNLVIFKLILFLILVFSPIKFTFQSGDIQIILMTFDRL